MSASPKHGGRFVLYLVSICILIIVSHSATAAGNTITADDNQGRVYPLTVEFMAPVTGLDDVTQVIVRLPDDVIGAPRNLGVTVRVRGPISNKSFISIAGP